ncbi:O81 family O-antigen flippase [Citrobacter sp.]|uniref:O81 family O-antigen flippase n=1 Tax=Citrobacter sp. TaxID=1896336 RepID=UPI0028FE36C1|nr:O81 family O-antigen flippase [Citrobacter sp.]MDU1874200.1 O81 family O-antigen flippase [Citrobacter sp.]
MATSEKEKKYKTISLLSICFSSIRVFVGPVTLLVLAKKLSSEELGFYYAFFSLTAMTQLLEVGMTGVLKQYYSHSYNSTDNKGNCDKISNYFMFSLYWYFSLAIVFFIMGGIVSYVMFKDYHGIIQWGKPWYFLLLISCISLILLPLNAMLDGTQKQNMLIRANIVSQLMVAGSLWIAIYSDFGLYSMGISQLSGVISFLISIYCFNKYSWFFIDFKKKGFVFKNVFLELWPLLKKTSVVWFLGYFYWNGFNIISFKYLGPEIAGYIGISISIMRAGQNIAMSILNSQMTLYANNIANGFIKEAKKIFDKYFFLSLTLLLIGYAIFYLLYFIKPDFFLFEKVLPMNQMVYISVFFIFTFIISGIEVFTRCFKVEKFIITQVINSILTPSLFLLGIQLQIKYFILPIASVLIVSILTILISKRFYSGFTYEKNN